MLSLRCRLCGSSNHEPLMGLEWVHGLGGVCLESAEVLYDILYLRYKCLTLSVMVTNKNEGCR